MKTLLSYYSHTSASIAARHWDYRKDCEEEVVEPLLGDAVTISISPRFLSHGTATHILSTSLLFIFLIINVAFFFLNLSAKPIFGACYEMHRLPVSVIDYD